MTPVDAEQKAITDLGADATGADLYRAGLACSTGQGAPLSYVEAHKWFNLAALAGVQEAKVYRRELSELMSSGEIAAAQESARKWMTDVVQGRRPAPAKSIEAKPAKTGEAKPVGAKRVASKRAPTARARVAA